MAGIFQGRFRSVNKYLFTEPIVNYSGKPERRVDLACGVSYGDDLLKVRDLVKKSLDDLPNRLPNRDVEVFFKEFGDSSINFDARIWVHYDSHVKFLETQSEAIIKIKQTFDDNDIMIPFPIRTLDFGIKGGEKLSELKLDVGNR